MGRSARGSGGSWPPWSCRALMAPTHVWLCAMECERVNQKIWKVGKRESYRSVGNHRSTFRLATPPICEIFKAVNNEGEHACIQGIHRSYPYSYKFIGGVR
jgi:hypothetical protein